MARQIVWLCGITKSITNIIERMKNIERIDVHPLKEIFGSEASGFTPWLAKNIGLLSEKLGINISEAEREHKLETMKVDIVAKAGDDGEKNIIIENQFGDSDSDHLGKVITYAAHHNAQYAVWIVEKARAEHISAIQMLNDSTIGCNFYMIEATAVSIGDSKPGILFDIVCEPPIEKTENSPRSDTEQRLIDFWAAFNEYANGHGTNLQKPPQSYHWINISTGTSKAHFDLFVRRGSVSVRLLLDGADKSENKKHYKLIEEDRDAINDVFGKPLLQWNFAESNKSSVIMATNYDDGGYEQDDWQPIFAWLLETYKRMLKIFSPYIDKMKRG